MVSARVVMLCYWQGMSDPLITKCRRGGLIMKLNWLEDVKDPKEHSILEALSDSKWDFRTMEALIKKTGLSQSEIELIILKYENLIRESPVRDRKGRRLFTLKSNKVSINEILNMARGVVSKST